MVQRKLSKNHIPAQYVETIKLCICTYSTCSASGSSSHGNEQYFARSESSWRCDRDTCWTCIRLFISLVWLFLFLLCFVFFCNANHVIILMNRLQRYSSWRPPYDQTRSTASDRRCVFFLYKISHVCKKNFYQFAWRCVFVLSASGSSSHGS